MIIRAAQAVDAAAIAQIANALVRDTLITFTTVEKDPLALEAEIAARAPGYLVACQDDAVVGFARYGPFRGGPGYAATAELSINLAPQARGKGTGRALLGALEDIARAQGLHVLVAGCSSANPGAIAFHQRMGYDIVARMPDVGRKAGQWLDLVLLQKVLSGGADFH